MADMLIIGIAGGSGSGKSTIARLIAEKFGDDVTVLRHDDYYKAQHDLTLEERARQNYDCPEAFDTALMAEHIRALRAGQAIDCPIYDYMIHDRVTETRRIEPRPVLLIDGILVLADARLRDLMDILWIPMRTSASCGVSAATSTSGSARLNRSWSSI